MELAFVLAFVLLGTAAIVYAGMRKPPARKSDTSGDGTPMVMADPDGRADGDSGSAGDGGGGGGD